MTNRDVLRLLLFFLLIILLSAFAFSPIIIAIILAETYKEPMFLLVMFGTMITAPIGLLIYMKVQTIGDNIND